MVTDKEDVQERNWLNNGKMQVIPVSLFFVFKRSSLQAPREALYGCMCHCLVHEDHVGDDDDDDQHAS